MLMNNVCHAKIGVFGGSFDPPHISHIDMAREIMRERGYERLVFLPSHNPPHKTLQTPDMHRLNMLELACKGEFEICTLEMDTDEIGYTADYIPKLKAIYGHDIEYIIGGDSMASFGKWSRPLDILKIAHILVASRDSDDENARRAISAYDDSEKLGITLASYKPSSMSSSSIRNKIRLGYDVTSMVDASVLDYITNNNLYNEYSNIKAQLGCDLSDKRYSHSLSTALFAVENISGTGLDYGKVMTATLLHDCAKESDDNDSLISYARANMPEIMADYQYNSSVLHAYTGMAKAMRDYGITDIEILTAICYHTTARVGMSELDKLVYVSDKLEYSRTFPTVERLRSIYYNNHNDGFIACLNNCYQHLLDREADIHQLSIKAYDEYVED